MLELKLMRIVRRPSVFRLMFRFDVLATVNVFPGAICCAQIVFSVFILALKEVV